MVDSWKFYSTGCFPSNETKQILQLKKKKMKWVNDLYKTIVMQKKDIDI